MIRNGMNLNLNSNILITSISKKVPLINAVKCARSKIPGYEKIIGGDSDNNCIGKFFVDKFWSMPQLKDISVEFLTLYCWENKIKCIIPTRDGELLFFSSYKKTLASNGIFVMVSDKNAVETCMDKINFYKTLKSFGFPVIETAVNIDEIEADYYVVKERYGSGSNNIGIKLRRNYAVEHAKILLNPVYQPYVEGCEFSVDLYVDIKGECKGVVVRSRDLVVNGESQVTTTLRNTDIENIAAKLAEKTKIYGHAVLQALIDKKKNELHIIECNSRFGGASTLSIEVGLDSFYWFMLEALGADIDEIPFVRSNVEKKLVRYAKDLII
ncbi:MAG: carbamoyl-phosphate synthase [Peptococcaceae bacterium BICA1-7]|nr:MAG: carbamoyl-phosphate synthase [Peptococcaceae bacterium BICA1-7]HBV96589.1 carbamoyl-phosphate synthase [Desulfotomaculum sp.]